jgi:hypothetical protein
LVKVLSFGLNLAIPAILAISFFTQDMAAVQCIGSSVQSVVQKVFPRLPFEVFSSQIESYGQLSLHVEDRI